MLRLWLLAGLIVPTLAAAMVASGVRIDPDDPPKGRFIDEWFVVRFGGADAGWAHTTLTRTDDRVDSQIDMKLTIRRAGQKIEMLTSESTTETVAGEPLSFDLSTKIAAFEINVSGKVENGKVHIRSSQFGNVTNQTYNYPRDAKMAWGQLAEQYRRGYAPNTRYTVQAYAPTLRADGAVLTHTEVQGKETIELPGGVKKEAIRVLTSIEVPGGFAMGQLSSTGWLDEDGTILKSQIPLPAFGMMELVRSDQVTAQAAGRTGAEIFMSTLIPVPKPIRCCEAEAITYKLRYTGPADDDPPPIPVTDMQKPGPWKERSMTLRVARIDCDKIRRDCERVLGAPADAGPEDPTGEFRAPNVWVNSQDAVIVEMAKEARGDETNRYRICDRLRRHVTDVIKSKNLGVGFASASEVARNKEGDCSEHAVLLAALGRALGVPSRVVTGLVYVPRFGDAKDVFGFHMWTQFYIAGRWVDFDAAQGESDCNPTHIALATSSMRDVTMAEFAFRLLGVIGQIEINVESVERIER